MAKVAVSFTLNSEADRDLVSWLDRLERGDKSEAIRETLRAGLARGGVTIGDVYQAVKSLERRLQAGQFVIRSDDPALLCNMDLDEPPGAAAALDALAELGS